MGIEPTSGLFPGRTTVLKTAAGTSPATAPRFKVFYQIHAS